MRRLLNIVLLTVVLSGVAGGKTVRQSPQRYGSSVSGGTTQSIPEVPAADTLYANGQRDTAIGNYALARQKFRDYLKYYGDTNLASNARFFLGEIAYSQKDYRDAVNQYSLLLVDYPKSGRIVAAHYKKGLALIELGQRTAGVRELDLVIRRFPGTEEERRARAKLQEMGIAP